MTRTPCLLVALLLFSSLVWGQPPKLVPVTVSPRFPTEDILLAHVVLEAPDAGDASPLIQAAIDAVAAQGGGTVFLHVGQYRLESPLVVKEGVTLRGDWAPPGNGSLAGQTLLMPLSGRGDVEGAPAIILERGTGLAGMNVWYPEQDIASVVPYPWAIKTSETVAGDNYTLWNVTLVNAYQGVKIGPEWNELHTLRNVYMTALSKGIEIDTVTDIGRLIHVSLGPEVWMESGLPGAPERPEEQTLLRQCLAQDATGVWIGRSDWEYLYDLKIDGYWRGLAFGKGVQGTTNAVMFGSRFVDCATALYLEHLNDIGLSATLCAFKQCETAVVAPESLTGVAQFNTCEFSGSDGVGVKHNGRGTLTFQNCDFGQNEVLAESGRISLIDNQWRDGPRHVRLGEGVRVARILGNRFETTAVIENAASRGDVMISHRALDLPRLDVRVEEIVEPPYPRPASGQLFRATDFGASPELSDNTSSFQAALDEAAQSGGGTVYVSAGNYRFNGELRIPSGVELRGTFDVPHHIQSGGTVLMPYGSQNDPDGTPFTQLEASSGLRGLSVFYPEQSAPMVTPYPWTVRSLGPACWLVDVTLSGAYQGVDFGAHPSDGHYVRYLAGSFLKKGLHVGNSDSGWVEDCQFNPHYGVRLHASLPQPRNQAGSIGELITYQRGNLEGIVVGRCENEYLIRNFLYAAYDGLSFRNEGGGAQALVINHGSDTVSRSLYLEATGDEGVTLINTQLVPLSDYAVGAVVSSKDFQGRAVLYNTQVWAGDATAVLDGKGEVVLQQMNTLSGGIALHEGAHKLQNLVFKRMLPAHVSIMGSGSSEVLGSLCLDSPFRIDKTGAGQLYARGNGLAIRPNLEAGALATGWEANEPQSLVDTLANGGGGIKNMEASTCGPESFAEEDGTVLRMAGQAGGDAFVYYTLFETDIAVRWDTVLKYRIQPRNELSRHTGIDLQFNDGTMLRDTSIKSRRGVRAHPSNPRGKVDEWTSVEIPIGQYFGGKHIVRVMAAYDNRGGPGAFETYFDDLAIAPESRDEEFTVRAEPQGGVYPEPVTVSIGGNGGLPVRYTLDGTMPAGDSPLYEDPLLLDKGLWELRFAVETAPDTVSPWAFGGLYEVQP